MLSDKVNIKGHVTIRDTDGNMLLDKYNHIVFTGRNFFMQRFMGVDFNTTDNTRSTWLPRWFGAGCAGATMAAPFVPLQPMDRDRDVFSKLLFDNKQRGRYDKTFTKKTIDEVKVVSSTVCKLTMVIDEYECVGAYINELGLFAAPTTDIIETEFVMISHVTFPSIPKSHVNGLVIDWTFLF